VEMNFGFKPKPVKGEDQPQILIAGCYQDQEFARKLTFALRRDRVSPFIQIVGEMTAGDSLVRKLESTTRPVDCVVPVISIVSVTHQWVERELIEVMSREINHRWVRTYPAKVDNCHLPSPLASRFVADFYGLGWSPAYEALKAAIHGRLAAERPAPRQQPAARAPRPSALNEVPAAADSKQLYLSFDHRNDGYYRDVLITWSKMPGFAHFWVNSEPPAVAVDSPGAEPIKQALAKRIGAASGLLCVIGPMSSTDGWMDWEIKKADELGKRVVAVRVNRDCEAPALLSDVGATCAMSFTFEGIRRAIEEAYGETSFD